MISKETEAVETLDFGVASLLRTTRVGGLPRTAGLLTSVGGEPRKDPSFHCSVAHFLYCRLSLHLEMMESGHRDEEKTRSVTISTMRETLRIAENEGPSFGLKANKREPQTQPSLCGGS